MPLPRSKIGKRSKDREARELKQQMNIPAIGGGGVTDHGALTGLPDDDHANYVHLTAPRTIVGQHSFSPSSAQAPFLLGANAQSQLVTGLRADELNKDVIAGAGLITGGTLTTDVTLSVGDGNGITVNADDIAIDLQSPSGLNVTGSGLTLANSIAGTGIDISAKVLSHATGDIGDVHTNYAEHDQVENITGAWTFQTDLLPQATDTYDVGSPTKLWRKGYLSELETILFITNAVRIEGGWFIVGHNAGTVEEDVDGSETQIDFGIDENGIENDDFILFRTSLQVEYMKIVSQVGGAGTTIWNVTRDVDTSGPDSWAQGTPFLVLGNVGDGRIELVATQSDSPKISIVDQGATYNAQTEHVRIGNMRGAYGIGANDFWGFGVGDFSGGNYMKYDDDGGFELKAGDGAVKLNEEGLTLTPTTTFEQVREIKFVDASDNFWAHWQLRDWAGTIESYITVDVSDFPARDAYSIVSAWSGDSSHYGQMVIKSSRSGVGATAFVDLLSDTSNVNSIWMAGASFDGVKIGGASRGTVDYTLHVIGDGYFSTMLNVVQGLRVGDATLPVNDIISATGDIRAGGGLYSGSSTGNANTGDIECTTDAVIGGGAVIGNQTLNPIPDELTVVDRIWVGLGTQQTNNKMTTGIQVYTAGNDYAYAATQLNLAHGAIVIAPTNQFFGVDAWSDANGGAVLRGFSDDAQSRGIMVYGLTETQDIAAPSTSSKGVVMTSAADVSGTTHTATGTNACIFVATNNDSARMVLRGNGRLYTAETVSGGTHILGDFDDFEDMPLLHGIRASLSHAESELRHRFGKFIDYARPVMEASGIIVYNDGPGGDGVPFVDHLGLQMLTIDAVRQFHGQQTKVNENIFEQLRRTYAKMHKYEVALLNMGVNPKLLI